jgi:hypothetical protein
MTVIVDNTGFSIEYWSRFTETEFIEQNIKHGVFKQYPENSRRELLKQTFQLIIDTSQSTTKT